MRRKRRNAVLLLLAGVLLVGLALGYDHSQSVYWVGGYTVQVATERTGNRSVSGADYAVLWRQEWAAAEGNPANLEYGTWQPVNVPNGGSFMIHVRSHGRWSGLGLRNGRARQKVLLVKVEYADGGSHFVVADIPDFKGPEPVPMTVQVP